MRVGMETDRGEFKFARKSTPIQSLDVDQFMPQRSCAPRRTDGDCPDPWRPPQYSERPVARLAYASIASGCSSSPRMVARNRAPVAPSITR